MMDEFSSFMAEYFFSINIKKPSFKSEFFSEFSNHGIILEFSGLNVSTWEYPESFWSMTSHEDLAIGIEYKCSDNRSDGHSRGELDIE
jgi:hypothetical protein